MKTYKSHKVVEAAKITALCRNDDARGYSVECDDGRTYNLDAKVFARGEPDLGDYLVKYRDGYVSWSPAKEFEDGYTEQPAVTMEAAHIEGWRYTGLTFGDALIALKAGQRIQRQGWNGKGMWLCLIRGHSYEVKDFYAGGRELLPFIGMKTADDKFVPWLASQTDVLADDWVILT